MSSKYDKLLERLRNLDAIEKEDFFKIYLRFLSTSIGVKYQDNPAAFIYSQGWGADKYGKDWNQRAKNWVGSHGCVFWDTDHDAFFVLNTYETTYRNDIPIFSNYAELALREMPTYNYKERNSRKYDDKADAAAYFVSNSQGQSFKTTGNKEVKTLKNTANKMLDKNKDAAALAGKITVGKTANRFFLSKLAGKLPWYSKLFGGKKKVEENALAKLVTAQAAAALATHFSNSDKLEYITDAMVQEAMIDITANSQMLENLVKELESAVDLPSFGKEQI